MASFSKWLGVGLGWAFGGPIGALLGYVLGNFVGEGSGIDFLEYKNQKSTGTTTSGDFEVSLLILAAVVIKADGKVDPRELKFVRSRFLEMYGKARADSAFKLFKGIVGNNNFSTQQICMQINSSMNHASRLQLLHFLFGVAKADGIVTEEELHKIKTISRYLNIRVYDFDSIKAMFYNDVDSAYKILEIDKSSSNTDVKKAYRKMVKKYHPDKLQNLGSEHIQGAKDKFLQVQKAYEQIQEERDM